MLCLCLLHMLQRPEDFYYSRKVGREGAGSLPPLLGLLSLAALAAFEDAAVIFLGDDVDR